MALQPQATHAAQRRDEILKLAEGRMHRAANRALRRFLRRVLAAIHAAPGLTASAEPLPQDPFTAAQAQIWWSEALGAEVLPVLESVWRAGYSDTSTTASSLDAVTKFLATVQDRLSPTHGPALPQDAFAKARLILTQEAAAGSSTNQVAQRLAAEFSWDDSATYWRKRKVDTLAKIDAILDPIGPPGDPARELARRTDPRVDALQALNAEATKHIDAVESTWQSRAKTIARTESTAAFNFGSLHAYAVEGVSCIKWVATHDNRTRESHRHADGEIVQVGHNFTVSDLGHGKTTQLRMPGDPTGPAWAVINCRCTTVAADCP
jgi:SPP1 gp7 family putative phage head morphogenesis protein